VFRGKTRNKFKARSVNGFPSKLEAAVYEILLQRQRQGEIKDIKRQHAVILQDGPREIKISWKIDFSATRVEDDAQLFFEAKGIETEAYKLKLKMFRARPQGILEVWKGDYRRPKLVEVIRP
jgi:hypothetical protein